MILEGSSSFPETFRRLLAGSSEVSYCKRSLVVDSPLTEMKDHLSLTSSEALRAREREQSSIRVSSRSWLRSGIVVVSMAESLTLRWSGRADGRTAGVGVALEARPLLLVLPWAMSSRYRENESFLVCSSAEAGGVA